MTSAPAKKSAGKLLEKFRGPLSQTELADRLGITGKGKRQLISNWENDIDDIPGKRLLKIKHALHLTLKQYQTFIIARLPAFDPLWLEDQDDYRKAGLLLEAYRERFGWNQKELAQEIGVSSTTIGKQERSEIAVSQEAALVKEFRKKNETLSRADRWFGDPEVTQLHQACELSNPLVGARNREAYRIKIESTTLGATRKQSRTELEEPVKKPKRSRE